MTPTDYCAKWKLPADYPMVAPDYAERRRVLANNIGLGRKRDATDAPDALAEEAPPPPRRARVQGGAFLRQVHET